MQKNKITEEKFREQFTKNGKWKTVIPEHILDFISQERKQWEEEMREKLLQIEPIIKEGEKVYYDKDLILSLLESKEEKCWCCCHCHNGGGCTGCKHSKTCKHCTK